MGACRRDWVIQKRADLRNRRSARNICRNETGLDAGKRLRPGCLPRSRTVECHDTSCQGQDAQKRASILFHEASSKKLWMIQFAQLHFAYPKLEVFRFMSSVFWHPPFGGGPAKAEKNMESVFW